MATAVSARRMTAPAKAEVADPERRLQEAAETVVAAARGHYARLLERLHAELTQRDKAHSAELSTLKTALEEQEQRWKETRTAISEKDREIADLREALRSAEARRVAEPRGTSNRVVAPAPKAPAPPFVLVEYLTAKGMAYTDKRPRGALWVEGGPSLAPFFKKLEASHGVTFKFFEEPRATNGRPAWWTKDPQ